MLKERHENLQWEHTILEQRCQQAMTERDELYSKFESSIYDVQQKSGFKNLLLEKKLEALTEVREMHKAVRRRRAPMRIRGAGDGEEGGAVQRGARRIEYRPDNVGQHHAEAGRRDGAEEQDGQGPAGPPCPRPRAGGCAEAHRSATCVQYELARVTKAHNDMVRVYEAKLREFGVPAEELGFKPLQTNTSTMPAGLVVSG